MNCQTCQHFLVRTEQDGLCRRFPPALVAIDGLPVPAFPPMLNEGLCGEHKEKQDA